MALYGEEKREEGRPPSHTLETAFFSLFMDTYCMCSVYSMGRVKRTYIGIDCGADLLLLMSVRGGLD